MQKKAQMKGAPGVNDTVSSFKMRILVIHVVVDMVYFFVVASFTLFVCDLCLYRSNKSI